MATALFQLTIKGRAEKDYNEVVLHFEADGTLTASKLDLADILVTRFIAAVLPDWLACFPNEYQCEGLVAKQVSGTGGPQSVTIFQDGDEVGTGAGDFCGNQVCPVIRLIPTLGTQTGGRIFLPCVSYDALVSNAYQAGYLADVTSLMNILLNDIGTGAIEWWLSIYSRKNDSSSRVSGWSLSPAIGFQRRRARPLG